MIRMVIGLPGGGKTYYMVTKIIEELRYTERFIVTNCEELDLPRIREYLQEVDPDREIPIDLDERLLVIPKEETFRFYRHRSGGLVLPMPREANAEGRRLKREEFLAGMVDYFLPTQEKPAWSKPVSYFIVEAHDYFNAQDWQEVGRAAQYYATKHRHLHDEIILETQLVEQCDASMRRLVEQTHEIENHYNRSFGMFANRGCFKRRVYFKQKGPASIPYETTEFKLDPKGIGSCYHTTGALGMMDRGKEAKGFGRVRKLPWWTLWIGAAAAMALVFLVIATVPKLIGGFLGSIVSGTTEGMRSQLQAGAQPGKPLPPNRQPEPLVDWTKVPGTAVHRAPDTKPAAPIASDVLVTGILQQGARITITLSDGRVFTEQDVELGPDSGSRVDRHSVTIAGVRYYFAKPAMVYPRSEGIDPTSPGQPGGPRPRRSDENSEYPAQTHVSTESPNSSWYTDQHGVQRLRNHETLSDLVRR